MTQSFRRLVIFGEVFEWDGAESGRAQIFLVTPMLASIRSGALPHEHVTSPINLAFANTWLTQRELDEDKIRAMSISDVRRKPVLGLWMPDRSVLLVDGGHRYMACVRAGDETIDYVLVDEPHWHDYRRYRDELGTVILRR